MKPESPAHLEGVQNDNSRSTLERILEACRFSPEALEQAAREVERIFGEERAVLVMDMSGFSRTTVRHGIISSLFMIHRVKQIARPCIEGSGGLLVKAEADNLFCLFDAPAQALAAAGAIVRGLRAANHALPEEQRLSVSVGIGFGRILNIGNEDLFGHEVNLASKLGEDIGQGSDILLTAAAHRSLPPGLARTREEAAQISGLTLPYFVVEDFNAQGC
ncbi:MAG TPA: adenylate/guanylate cyclase domain-containing protein [Noviherbaspirillum sp.]|uniref:adenylate/guanylate cyclase domain-containing protein n=1 Tax=Noviherbaspirillum sp. TaxID=1926288 RepID=UPI002D7478C2|nr:adenylate/guanylate cyclase domain-containing protein [Noviherbaspirillum sp.]HYD97427.1 adenylate/guanylate cyclase domain-containing protein [Noviherbaspirillum sp.]